MQVIFIATGKEKRDKIYAALHSPEENLPAHLATVRAKVHIHTDDQRIRYQLLFSHIAEVVHVAIPLPPLSISLHSYQAVTWHIDMAALASPDGPKSEL